MIDKGMPTVEAVVEQGSTHKMWMRKRIMDSTFDPPRVAVRTARNTLFALFLVHFFASMDRYAFTVLLEPIKADLNATDAQMGLISGLAFVVCYVIFGIPLARLIDTGVRKTIVVVSLAIWSAVTALTSLSSSVLSMGLFRAALGSAEAGAIPASLSMIADTFPKEKRHQAVSIFQLGAGISPIVGVPLVAIIAEHFGWKAAMITIGAGGIILSLILSKTLREPLRGNFDSVSDRDQKFTLWQSLVAIWRNYGLVAHILSHTIITCATTIFVIWANAYLMRVLNFSMAEAGLITGSSGVLTVVGVLGGGWICSKLIAAKHDDRWIAGFSGLVAITCAISFAIMLWSTNLMTFFIGFGLVNLLIFSRVAPAMTLSADLVHPRMRGLSSALTVGLSSLVGGGLAPFVLGRLSDHFGSSMGPAEGLRLALLYTTVPCALIGALLAALSVLMIRAPSKSASTGGLS